MYIIDDSMYISFPAGEMHKSEPSLVPDQYPKYSLAKNNLLW